MKSVNAINIILEFENTKLKPYLDPVGILTIGIGHKMSPGEQLLYRNGITKEKAVELLESDMAGTEKALNKLLKVVLTQNQYDALVSLCFNVGVPAFSRGLTIRLINKGLITEASPRILLYNKAKGEIEDGLTRRRKCEKFLYDGGTIEQLKQRKWFYNG